MEIVRAELNFLNKVINEGRQQSDALLFLVKCKNLTNSQFIAVLNYQKIVDNIEIIDSDILREYSAYSKQYIRTMYHTIETLISLGQFCEAEQIILKLYNYFQNVKSYKNCANK